IADGPPREADLVGRHVVITAGGTREPIDPVRYIGNRSTGRMGAALVEAALARGARVTLIAAAVEVPLPEGAEIVRVETAAELRSALHDAMAADADALVMAAAVADFTPAAPRDRKIPRANGLSLELTPTPDLLEQISAGGSKAYLVGFAAETGGARPGPGTPAPQGSDP